MKLSVIIPAYNIAEYIGRAISSVLDDISDDSEVELIVIDDGSTDDTSEIINKFTCRKNVRVEKVTHRGLGAARNVGIRMSLGDYIMFLDGDDYLVAGWLDALMIPISMGLEDMIIFQWQSVSENGLVREGPFASGSINDMGYACWNKCYRKNVVSEIYFPENVLFEDSGYSLMAWMKSRTITFIPYPLYNHRHREMGISREPHSFNQQMGVLTGLREALIASLDTKNRVKTVATDIILNRLNTAVLQNKTLKKHDFELIRNFYVQHSLWGGHFEKGKRHALDTFMISACLATKCYRVLNFVLKYYAR